MAFKENLKYIMESKGLILKELSQKTKISENTLKSYLKSESSEPKVSKAFLIANALGVSIEYLITGKDSVHKDQISPQVLELEKEMIKLTTTDLVAVSSIIRSLSEKY